MTNRKGSFFSPIPFSLVSSVFFLSLLFCLYYYFSSYLGFSPVFLFSGCVLVDCVFLFVVLVLSVSLGWYHSTKFFHIKNALVFMFAIFLVIAIYSKNLMVSYFVFELFLFIYFYDVIKDSLQNFGWVSYAYLSRVFVCSLFPPFFVFFSRFFSFSFFAEGVSCSFCLFWSLLTFFLFKFSMAGLYYWFLGGYNGTVLLGPVSLFSLWGRQMLLYIRSLNRRELFMFFKGMVLGVYRGGNITMSGGVGVALLLYRSLRPLDDNIVGIKVINGSSGSNFASFKSMSEKCGDFEERMEGIDCVVDYRLGDVLKYPSRFKKFRSFYYLFVKGELVEGWPPLLPQAPELPPFNPSGESRFRLINFL